MSPHSREITGARILHRLRDIGATDWASLCGHFDLAPAVYHTGHYLLRHALDDLREVGLVDFPDQPDADHSQRERGIIGQIELTPLWERLQTTLGISLAALAKFDSGASLVVTPYFGPPRGVSVRADVFVLMPFAPELKPVYDDHIAIVVKSQGLTVARADDFFTSRSVILDIWSALCKARLIIADCTSRNPNVFYEIGLAHVLGKSVVLITQDQNDIPFDLRHLRYIAYQYTPRGMQDLEKRLTETIRNEIQTAG